MKASTLKRRPKRLRPRISETTRRIAWHRTGGLCACGCGRMADDPHHIFEVKHFPELVDEPNNVVAIARYCHDNHHAAFRRLPRKITRHAALLAEGDPPMEAYLRSHYGRDE